MQFIIKYEKVFLYCSFLYAFTAFIGVSVLEIGLNENFGLSLLIELLLNIVFIAYLFIYKKIYISNEAKIFLAVYCLPLLVSIIIIPYNIFVVDEIAYQNLYLSNAFWNRLIHTILCLNIFVFCESVLNNSKDKLSAFIRIYFIGIIIVAALGLWQWLNFYYDVPFLAIETRSDVHSVESGLSLLNKHRITSIMREPSFLAPFIIDGLIIAPFIIKGTFWKYLYEFIFLFVLIFSFSLSAYFELAFLFIIVLLMKKKKKVLIIACLIICILLLSLIDYFMPIIGRLSIDLLINSARFSMVTMPFIWNTEHSIFSTLFGYGPGAYKFLNFTHEIYPARMADPTSNNLYVDFLFECGYFGFFAMIWYSFYLVFKSYRNGFFATLMAVHLVVTSLYRGEFVSARFFINILIIILLLKDSYKKEEINE